MSLEERKHRMKEREIFLDKLKVAAACAVVLLHTVTGVLDTADLSPYPLENKVFLILVDLSSWCVPVFLLISGYLFLNPGREISMGKMLTKYCRRVVLALLAFGTPYACLELIATEGRFRPGMPGEAFLMVLQGRSWSHMWYLYLLLILYLLTPGLKWVLARIPKPAVYGLLGLLFAECSMLPFLFRLLQYEKNLLIPEEGIYFFYYVCGYLFAKKGADGKGNPAGEAGSGSRMGGYFLSAFSLLLTAGMACSRLSAEYPVRMGYNYPFTLFLALALFGRGFCSRGRRSADSGGIPWGRLADMSFAVYLVHPVFLNLAYKFFRITPLSYPLGISLPLFFLGALLPAGGCAWIVEKIPPLKKYVL